MQVRLARALLLALAALGGCDNPVSPKQWQLTTVAPEWVTGAAATAVDPASGLFQVPVAEGAGYDAAHARALAHGYVRAFVTDGPFNNSRPVAEQDRGGRISWDRLAPCGRTVLVETPWGAPPPAIPRPLGRARGPRWAVSFCGPRGAELAIGVSEDSRSLDVVDGALVWTDLDSLSGVFSMAGVPERYPSGFPLTPEDAVATAFARFGTRIIEPPTPFDQLSPNGSSQMPFCASWRLVLEAPVEVHRADGSGAAVVDVLFLRNAPGCYSPDVVAYAAETPFATSTWVRFVRGPVAAPVLDSALVELQGPTSFYAVVPTP